MVFIVLETEEKLNEWAAYDSFTMSSVLNCHVGLIGYFRRLAFARLRAWGFTGMTDKKEEGYCNGRGN